MNDLKTDLFPFIIKTSIVHTVTYFIAGVAAMTLLDYGQTMGTENSIFKPITDPIVMAGPLLQPIRGVIFALAFYLIRHSIFGSKLGWLKLWWLLIALGVLSTFGPAPGSIEAIIYTKMDLSVFTYVEVVLQAFAFSCILYYWVNNKNLKWLNWVMGVAFAVVMLLPTLGLLVEQ
ncbi:hypothetical protein [Pontibacter pamirensis]|uniref:hypothetical protein n=1 Tax=Pontibacter pamirensis TaxID=2562824 RepID=UPI001389E27C|nr:hypothetical protein [Pontibacter pamirensis]